MHWVEQWYWLAFALLPYARKAADRVWKHWQGERRYQDWCKANPLPELPAPRTISQRPMGMHYPIQDGEHIRQALEYVQTGHISIHEAREMVDREAYARGLRTSDFSYHTNYATTTFYGNTVSYSSPGGGGGGSGGTYVRQIGYSDGSANRGRSDERTAIDSPHPAQGDAEPVPPG
jgi:hypothetical protein